MLIFISLIFLDFLNVLSALFSNFEEVALVSFPLDKFIDVASGGTTIISSLLEFSEHYNYY
jgi:hypothetical protein